MPQPKCWSRSFVPGVTCSASTTRCGVPTPWAAPANWQPWASRWCSAGRSRKVWPGPWLRPAYWWWRSFAGRSRKYSRPGSPEVCFDTLATRCPAVAAGGSGLDGGLACQKKWAAAPAAAEHKQEERAKWADPSPRGRAASASVRTAASGFRTSPVNRVETSRVLSAGRP